MITPEKIVNFCSRCNGSGEGYSEDTVCLKCRGSGEEPELEEELKSYFENRLDASYIDDGDWDE